MELALADQGFTTGELRIECAGGPCLSPGGTAVVDIGLRVTLPFLPESIGDTTVGSVDVRAQHQVPIDVYRSAS